MRKFIIVFLIGMAAIASILFFNGQNENIAQEGRASPTHATGRALPINETQALPAENTGPVSSRSADILLINAGHPLPESYKPAELINLFEQKGRHFQLAKNDIEICRTVFNAMESMFSAAKKDGVDGFIITSGYRSSDKQAEILASSKDGIAARPGTSEHETGLAFDVTAYGNKNFELTPQFEWLSQHCGEYGFILRYPKGREDITGYPYEPWHYRYVGTPYAKEIMARGITLEEYAEQP
jgi:D-alanyl-D-alanine carboxypeptidase